MRIIVLLKPTNKRGTKTAYTKFRKVLLADSFTLVDPEIFMSMTTNRQSAKIHVERIPAFAPTTGIVKVLMLTERQYHSMTYLTGEDDYQERMVGGNCHVIL